MKSNWKLIGYIFQFVVGGAGVGRYAITGISDVSMLRVAITLIVAIIFIVEGIIGIIGWIKAKKQK